MILRGVDFGPVFNASGARGFFGEGYWYHKFFRLFGLNFDGCCFVAKTTTLEKKEGNMPLKEDGITPRNWFPKCIKVYPFKGGGMVLNAVGLSGPGAKALFEDGRWQERKDPFFISFMSVAGTSKERMGELKAFVEMFGNYLPGFNASIGLQLNCSCPNVNLDEKELVGEIMEGLKIADRLEIPLMPKFSIVTPVEAVKEICDSSPYCDAICVSNTVLWGKLPDKIGWKGLFGTNESLLAEFGGGGLSGRPLFAPLVDWIFEARKAGIKKPINAGGGIFDSHNYDVDIIFYALADRNSSVSIGSVAILRPWEVPKIIERAHKIFGKEECDGKGRL